MRSYRSNPVPMYAIVDEDGFVLETVEGSTQEAVGIAQELGGEQTPVFVDGTALAMDQAVANKERLPMLQAQETAAKRMGLPRISSQDFSAILRMPLAEAHALIFPYFEGLPPPREGGESHVWKKPNTAAKAFIGGNEKLSKRDPAADLGNSKLFAGQKHRDVVMAGLALLPHRLAFGEQGSGNWCVGSNQQCRQACLVYSGHNPVAYNVEVKRSKSRALIEQPQAFLRMLVEALERRIKKEHRAGYEPFFRLNVFSDIPWEIFCPSLFEHFSDTQFYDYSKVPGRETPDNYDITFSFSGSNKDFCESELSRGHRVAAVFLNREKEGRKFKHGMKDYSSPLPEEFLGHEVVNGDKCDARPLDPVNAISDVPVVVGLHYKIPSGVSSDIKNLEKMSFVTMRRNPDAPRGIVVLGVNEIDGQLTIADTPGMTPFLDPDDGIEDEE